MVQCPLYGKSTKQSKVSHHHYKTSTTFLNRTTLSRQIKTHLYKADEVVNFKSEIDDQATQFKFL